MNFEAIKQWIRQFPIVSIFGALSILLIFLVFNRAPKVSQLESANANREREWGNMRLNTERSAGLEPHLEHLKELAEEVEQRLITADAIANNYDYFYSIERQTNVRILNIQQLPSLPRRPAHVPDLKDFDQVTFNLTVQGQFAPVITFIQGLERGRNLIRIDSMNMSREGDTRTITVRMELNLLGRKGKQ